MKIKSAVYFLFAWLLSNVVFSQSAQKAAEHAAERKVPATFLDYLTNPAIITKYVVMILIAMIVFALLKTKKMTNHVKVPILLVVTFLFGVAGNFWSLFAMHPSPMCVAEKPFLFGLRIPMLIALIVIFLLTLIGPRLFCGWVCPVGAIQELIAMLADKFKIRRIKYNFTAAQTVRLGLFLAFIIISATVTLQTVFEGKVFDYKLSIYQFLNAFHGLEIEAQKTFMDYIIHYIPFLLTVVLAIKLYRPFCYLVCPMGLFTHFLEQISLFKVRFIKNACTDCGICTEKAPCPTMPDILTSSTLRPDCYSCNVCIEECPENALDIGICRTVQD